MALDRQAEDRAEKVGVSVIGAISALTDAAVNDAVETVRDVGNVIVMLFRPGISFAEYMIAFAKINKAYQTRMAKHREHLAKQTEQVRSEADALAEAIVKQWKVVKKVNAVVPKAAAVTAALTTGQGFDRFLNAAKAQDADVASLLTNARNFITNSQSRIKAIENEIQRVEAEYQPFIDATERARTARSDEERKVALAKAVAAAKKFWNAFKANQIAQDWQLFKQGINQVRSRLAQIQASTVNRFYPADPSCAELRTAQANERDALIAVLLRIRTQQRQLGQLGAVSGNVSTANGNALHQAITALRQVQ